MSNCHIVEGTSMVSCVCGTCAVHHAIPEVIYNTCREEGGYWHCPNGHQRGFRDGIKDREKLRRERDQLKQDNARLEEAIAIAERARIAAQGALKKHRKRSAAGLCPCCNRSFANMTRHMQTQHPSYNVVKLKA